MALTTGTPVQYADVKNIYTKLNYKKSTNDKYGRSDFGFSNITIPELQNKTATAAQVSTLNSFIKEMASNNFLKNIATGTDVPAVGSLIKTAPITALNTQVDTINNTCPFTTFGSDFSGNFANFGSDFSGNFANFGSDFSGNFSHLTTDFSGDFGNFVHFGSNFSGHFGSNFSSHFGTNKSGNFSKHFGEFNAAVFT